MIETSVVGADPTRRSFAEQDREDREVARRLRNVRVATTLELIDELAPSVDVARKARVRIAGSYGFAAATVDQVRDVITHLTPLPAEDGLT